MTPPIKLYLIRHGQPSAGFGEDPDPGLDELGRQQAAAVAKELEPLGPLSLITSPLQRARDTAVPFENMWKCEAQVEQAVAEIPSPTQDLEERTIWIRQAMHGRWSDLSEFHQQWKARLIDFLCGLENSTVITSHFVAINAAVGAATHDDRMICFEPDHCSCTVLEVADGTLRVVTLGKERETSILAG
jgi:broad specificity phosphatase PhoE